MTSASLLSTPAPTAADDQPASPLARPLELSVVVPTYNEHGNIRALLAKLRATLGDLTYEVIFVDDDSKDGTPELVREIARSDPQVRLVHRIGRRGLASACIEGMQASPAPYVAVMDADMQHDEGILPAMVDKLRQDGLDIVIGTRFAQGGSTGDFAKSRLRLSQAGTLLSRLITRARVSDPMSGFFVLRRAFLQRCIRRLSGQGFKILLDLFASSPEPVKFAEVPYTFRDRHAGESKLDTLVMLEYIMLIADKTIGKVVPVKFILFVLVGFIGVFVHLAVLGLTHQLMGLPFIYGQALAGFTAMTFNFNLNNVFTHRDRRLRGRELIRGHVSFYLICSVGLLASTLIGELLFERGIAWAFAGFLGSVVGSVWNYGVSSTFTWRRKPA